MYQVPTKFMEWQNVKGNPKKTVKGKLVYDPSIDATKKKMKKAPAYIFNLLYIMSSCTVLWGILTGTYFGINFESLPSSLQNISNEWLRGYGDNNIAMNNIMFFCFVLGTTHLVIGHIWNLIRKINSWAALSDLSWI